MPLSRRPMAAGEVYEFGPFVVDATERQCFRDDRPIALPPKALGVLLTLVRRAGHLVTKRELLDALWPDVHVEEGVLAVHVSALRKVFGDDRERSQYIETVSGSGYRFTADVRRSEARSATFSFRWPLGVLPAHSDVSELIARGRAHLLTSSRREIPKAVALFEAAIARDATYAPAHAGLALAACAQAELRLEPVPIAFERARDAALRALAMDSGCADAQVALGAVLFLNDWNWAGAQRSLERALDVDSGNTDAHLLYGRLLDALGDLDRGLAAKYKAHEREPFSARIHLHIAQSLWNQRRYDEVIAWAGRALALDDSHLLAREFIAGAYLMKGDSDRHMAESLAHAAAYGVPESALADARTLYAERGRAGVIHATLSQGGHAPPVQRAILLAELGELDEALSHLNRAIDARDPCLVDLSVAPQWDPLRQHPGFAACLERMQLPRVRVAQPARDRRPVDAL